MNDDQLQRLAAALIRKHGKNRSSQHHSQFEVCYSFIVKTHLIALSSRMDSRHQLSIEKELSNLGDPSGRQDSAYWDQWFEVVCAEDHRPFEWYCDVKEVVRVLSYHLNSGSTQSGQRLASRMIHPGSGTSLVPLKLRDVFSGDQVVVDVSPVAVEEMRRVHEQQFPARDADSGSIQYLVADILSPPLPFEADSFECWVDKGFVDAVFSKKSETSNRDQSRKLFEEANRLLKAETGVALIVSLAEDHSLQLLLDSAFTGSWRPDVHVWEIAPVSGDMRPFGFVFTKADIVEEQPERRLVWHSIGGEMDEASSTLESLLDLIRGRVAGSREAFSLSQKSKEKSNAIRKVLVTLEVKPFDAETDLKVLGGAVRASTWQTVEGEVSRTLCPLWQPFEGDENVMEQIIPIGYGISKLQLKCIIPSDDVDHLVSAIEDWEGDGELEGVQSVDVDWANTIPIGNAQELLGGYAK
jgi:translation elongation factor EF-1beta